MLEKNQVYVISEEPKIVGVVKRLKCARDNRWVISATDGHEYIYNSNSGSWSRGSYSFAEFEPLSEEKLLEGVQLKVCCGECSCEGEQSELNLIPGQVWEDEEGERVLILDVSLNGEYIGSTSNVDTGHYYILGVHVDRSAKDGTIEYYNSYGNAYGLLGGEHNLTTKIVETIDFSLV